VASPLDVAVFVLSVACGVLGGSLLAHRGVRMMKGGLLYTVSIGLAVIGLVLTVESVLAFAPDLPVYVPQAFQIAALVVLYFIAYAVWSNATKIQEGA